MPTDTRGVLQAVAQCNRIAPSEPARYRDLDPVWVSTFRQSLPIALRSTPLQSHTSLEFDLGLDSLDRLAFFYTVAAQISAEIDDEDALNAAHTLGDVAEYFGGAGRVCNENAAVGGSAAYFAHGAPKTASHFLRAATLTWPIVQSVRLLLWHWARKRLDLRVVGSDRVDWSQRPLLIAQNHQSIIDPLLLAAALPASVHRRLLFLGFAGYFNRGAGRLASRLFRVHPCSADVGLASGFRAGARALQSGMTLAIYPEGERTWDGSLRPFKRGVAWLAREARASVVPSAIVGAFEAWPRNWPFLAHPVRIAFGPPIPFPAADAGLQGEVEFLATLRSAISELMQELRADPIRGVPEVWADGPSAAPFHRRASQ
ncbi:MAG: 1-acyl-sn-glycerol-3-phosphate acyltransferase [Acidobacteriota bacterium]